MTTIREIVAYLREIGASDAALPGAPAGDREVSGVATDTAAGAADPARAGRFAGALLIAPRGVAGAGALPVVECDVPKLAFTLVVERFFGDLAETRWPAEGERVAPDAVIGRGVSLGPGVVIGSRTVLHEGVVVGPNSCISNAEVGAGTRIGCNCTIGLPGFGYERDETSGRYVRFPHLGRVVIGEGVEIGNNTCIDRGSLGDTRIERGARIDNLVHVAHNVVIGENAMVIAHAMLGGSARVGRDAWIAPTVAVMNQLSVGDGAVVGMGAVVIRPVEPGATVVGNPAKPLAPRGVSAADRGPETGGA